MKELYKTLYQKSEGGIIEKRSRFAAHCAPVSTEQQALEFIASVRGKHKTEDHSVFAYSLRDGNLCRYSDDGEPQGTAGLPTLDILKRGEIVDAAIVVARYFGGTLLGTGGLARAYSGAAALAVKQAGIAVMEMCSVYEIECDYMAYDRLCRLFESFGATIISNSFTEKVILETAIHAARAGKLLAEILELTRGQTRIKHVCDRFERTAVVEANLTIKK